MSRLRLTTLVLFVFLAQTALAAKDYYMWVDENGITNFSAQRPKDHPEAKHITDSTAEDTEQALEDSRRPGHEDLPTQQPVTPPPAPKAKQPAAAPAVDPEQAAAAERAKIEKQLAATKRANCDKARKNLAMLQTRPRIRSVGPDGQERVMSDDEKQSKIDNAQTAIQENCSP